MAIPAQARRLPSRRDAAPPPDPTFGEGVAASFREGRRDIPGFNLEQRSTSYGPLVDALRTATGKPIYRWVDLHTGQTGADTVWSDIEEQRRRDPKFLAAIGNREQWEQAEEARVAQGRQEDRDTESRSGWAAWLTGQIGAGLTDPINLVLMMLGGGAASSLGRLAVREAGINALTEAVQQPLVAAERAGRGETLTVAEAAANVALGGVIGGGVPVTIKGAGELAAPVIERGAAAVIPRLPERWQAALASGAPLPDVAETTIGRDNMTPTERAAVDVLRREDEIDAGNPFAADGQGVQANRDLLADAIRGILGDSPAPSIKARMRSGTAGAGVGVPVASIRADAGSVDRIFDALIQQESGGRAGIAGPLTKYGKAYGLTQVLDSTGAAVAKKLGVRWQPELMRATTPEGAAYQRMIGRAYFDEGLQRYGGDVRKALMYYHGGPDQKLWGPKTRAYADEVLARTGGGTPSTVGVADSTDAELATLEAEARRLAGESDAADAAMPRGGSSPVSGAMADWDERFRSRDFGARFEATADLPAMELALIPTSRIDVDAQLMQFKSGGDAQGVTDRLAGVETWNPLFAGRIILWERNDGKLIAADGHQRVGLAKRLDARDGSDIVQDAIILREADGVRAVDARMLAAAKNISEGTGTLVDAAKVFRDGGPSLIKLLPPRSALVRDGTALSRLGDQSFGAIVNDVTKPEYGAIVGRTLPDNDKAQMALIELLAKTKPANRAQAESIVRQGIAAGFADGVQTDMFGSLDTMASLFLERAKVMDAAIGRLSKLKTVFKVAGDNAGTIESGGVGNIDATKAAQEALDNAQAIDLIQRAANFAGPIKDAIDRAARRLADGEAVARVTDGLVADIRKIDLRDAMVVRDRLDAGEDARSPQGSGEGFDDPVAEAPDTETFNLFGDPQGPTIEAQRGSLEHDSRTLAPAPDKAAAPSGPQTEYRLNEEGATISAADVVKRIDEEDAAINEVRSCL